VPLPPFCFWWVWDGEWGRACRPPPSSPVRAHMLPRCSAGRRVATGRCEIAGHAPLRWHPCTRSNPTHASCLGGGHPSPPHQHHQRETCVHFLRSLPIGASGCSMTWPHSHSLVENHVVCGSAIVAPNHEAMMLGSTPGGSNHGTCMPYVNAQRKVSLVNPLLVRSLQPADTVCFIFMLDAKW